MKRTVIAFMFLVGLMNSGLSLAQTPYNFYDMRNLTREDWESFNTEDRLRTLATAKRHSGIQTFVGRFNRDNDLYRHWGYEFFEMSDRYENYAFREYQHYDVYRNRRNRWSYNDWGDRTPKINRSAVLWRERYYGDGTFTVRGPGHYINAVTDGQVDGVWMAREGTDDWTLAVVSANALRVKFTPLTLSHPTLEGTAIDFSNENTDFKFLNSIYVGKTDVSTVTGISLVNEAGRIYSHGGILFRGGSLRRKFGALTLGGTYMNSYAVLGNRAGGDDRRGHVSTHTPTPFMYLVRVLDSSPNDGVGPIVYDMKIRINGQIREDIMPTIIRDDVTRDRVTAFSNQNYLEKPPTQWDYDMDVNFMPQTFEDIPKYMDYMAYIDLVRGSNFHTTPDRANIDMLQQYYSIVQPNPAGIQVNGTEALVYIFDLTHAREELERVEMVAKVSGDYLIQKAKIWGNEDDHPRNHMTLDVFYNTSHWQLAAQSHGNVKDGSNIRTVVFDFGWEVANLIYGMDFDFNYLGFNVRGEFVTNVRRLMYAEGLPGAIRGTEPTESRVKRTGHRSNIVDNAYYVITQKDWDRIGFSSEIFKMGNHYSPYFDYYHPGQYGSARVYGVTQHINNQFVRVTTIEDNDDLDAYPDHMTVKKTMGYEYSAIIDPDGVFPGQMTQYGYPETNKNMNHIPDYIEPFLMFDSDPDKFIFGDDWNNNGIPDYREVDLKYDTPYDLDRQGHNTFIRLTPFRNINFIVGSMRTSGVGAGHQVTNNDYIKTMVDYNVFDVGTFNVQLRRERIKDNIADNYVLPDIRHRPSALLEGWSLNTSRFGRTFQLDRVEYRNSVVNRLWVDSRIDALPNIILENYIKLERNEQLDGEMYDGYTQIGDVINTTALVNKISYNRSFGNFSIRPGLKTRLYKKAYSDYSLEHEFETIPMVITRYDISERTNIMFGIQGFRGFEYTAKDYVNPQNDFSQRVMTLQVSNFSDYMGYLVWGSVGFTIDEKNYDDVMRSYEDYKTSGFFVTVNFARQN